MSDVIYKKLINRRNKETKLLLTRLAQAPVSRDKFFNMEYLFSSVDDRFAEVMKFPDNPRKIGQLLSSGFMRGDDQILPHIAHAFSEGDEEKLKLYYAYMIGRDYLVRQLNFALDPMRTIWSKELAVLTMGLYTIGWPDEALQVNRQLWQADPEPRIRFLTGDALLAWFSIYFTLGSRDLIAAATLYQSDREPDAPDSPYSFLLGCWNDPDPAKVRNALVACSEQNMARSLLPDSKRVEGGFDINSWWYVPWDILAINMRRRSLGVDWVETDDPRMAEVWQNREELPLVKDDLYWPSYLKLCDRLGVEPYKPRKSVEVRINRENFDFEVVG